VRTYRITDVDFDFSTDEKDRYTGYQNKIKQGVIGGVYDAEDEQNLAEVVSDDTGWLVTQLDYEEVK